MIFKLKIEEISVQSENCHKISQDSWVFSDFFHFHIAKVKKILPSSKLWAANYNLKHIWFNLVHAFTPKNAIEKVEQTHIWQNFSTAKNPTYISSLSSFDQNCASI